LAGLGWPLHGKIIIIIIIDGFWPLRVAELPHGPSKGIGRGILQVYANCLTKGVFFLSVNWCFNMEFGQTKPAFKWFLIKCLEF
jgi:hypothetical protein